MLEQSDDYVSEKMQDSFTRVEALDEALTLLLGHDAIFHPEHLVRRSRRIVLDRFDRTRQILLKMADDGASLDQFAAVDRSRVNPAMLGIFTDALGQSVEAVITANGCHLEINRDGIPSELLLERRDGDIIDGEKYRPKWVQKARTAEWRPNRHFKKRQRKAYLKQVKESYGN